MHVVKPKHSVNICFMLAGRTITSPQKGMRHESGHLQDNFPGRHYYFLGCWVGIGARNRGIHAYVLAALNAGDSLAAVYDEIKHLEDFILFNSSDHEQVEDGNKLSLPWVAFMLQHLASKGQGSLNQRQHTDEAPDAFLSVAFKHLMKSAEINHTSSGNSITC